MQLYLVRHAESENNAKPTYQRIEDPALTPRGRLQAQHLAQWTKTITIETLITSPFLRTLQTSRHILDVAPQRIHVWHDVYERGGCYRGHQPGQIVGGKGLVRDAIFRHVTQQPDQCLIDESITAAGWWNERPQESDPEAEQRAASVTERLKNQFGNNGQTVMIVTHADFKRILLKTMLPGLMDVASLGPMRNTGISKLNFDGDRWQLDWFNSVSHLPSGLITGNEH